MWMCERDCMVDSGFDYILQEQKEKGISRRGSVAR